MFFVCVKKRVPETQKHMFDGENNLFEHLN